MSISSIGALGGAGNITHRADWNGLGSRLAAWLHARPFVASLLLLAPAFLYLFALYALPLAQVMTRSLFTPEFGFDNYLRVFGNDIYWNSFVITFRISAIVTMVCLALGYPVACMLVRLSAGWRAVAFTMIMIPFWTSALVRTYAWTVILQRRGVLNNLLMHYGIIDSPLTLIYSTTGTVIGNVHILLPTMILTLYSILYRIDVSLVTAARTMGASPLRAFFHVFLPLSISAIVAGSTLTLVASLSSYIIPALLGGRKDLFISQLIDQQVNQLLNVGFASAIAMALLLGCLVLCVVYTYIIHTQGGVSSENGLKRARGPADRYTIAINGYSALVIVFLVLPTFVLVPLSFSSARYLTFPPPGYSLQWYESYLGNPAWMEATLRSIRVGLASASVAALLGTLAAIGLSRTKGLLRYVLFALLLFPLLIPDIIYALAVYQLYSALGLIGTETGLVLAHSVLGIPYVVIAVSAALSAKDSQLTMAARTLGARPISAFAFVLFPLIRNSIFVGALLAFIKSFDEVVIAIFVSGARAYTLPKMMWDGVTNEINPTISAVSVLMISVSLLLLLTGYLGSRALSRRGEAASMVAVSGASDCTCSNADQ